MNRENTTEELLRIADQIKELTVRLRKSGTRSTQLMRELDELRYKHYQDVWATVDDKGKPVYSNEERRRHEVEHRVRNDSKGKKMLDDLDNLRNEQDELATEINRLEDRKTILLVSLGAPLPQDTLDHEEKSKYL